MQLVRNLCAEAVRRLRVTEAAAAHALRSLRDDSVQQQHRTRFVHGPQLVDDAVHLLPASLMSPNMRP
jgi:hypothetical protein